MCTADQALQVLQFGADCGMNPRHEMKVNMAVRGMGRRRQRPGFVLVLLLARLLATAFPRQSFFRPFLFARFQVVGVPFDLLNDVFLLNLALEPAQGVL
jgi:hypothetical protein